ncbi:hypothetical protein KZA79_004880 [Streptococcus mitis]|uniref:hypothetical protein n=1 Tax=Streptococcus mitis TaxID=28037 RepID=UPI001C55E42D|nr:hypothetical protein [Streptococcus mitis]MBW3453441.1 hypothetical protein [Streptococcus mitis]
MSTNRKNGFINYVFISASFVINQAYQLPVTDFIPSVNEICAATILAVIGPTVTTF